MSCGPHVCAYPLPNPFDLGGEDVSEDEEPEEADDASGA